MAFVTDALLRKSVVVCQALGRQGIDVAAGSTTRLSPAFFSRYCRDHLLYPSPKEQPAAFAETLLDYLNRHRHDVLLPTDDATLAVCSRYRSDFERVTRLPIPEPARLVYGLDKGPTMRLAERLRIPHPRTVLPASREDAADLARRLESPLVIKPRSSCGGRGIVYVGPGDDVSELWERTHRLHPYPMVQECIPNGQKFDVGVLMDGNGRALASFAQKELRHFPLRDGLSTMQESVWRPDLVERAITLLRAIGWYGLAEVEFMEHAGTGEVLLLEINPRFWASIQLAIACGVDFPHLLYRLAMGQPIVETHRYTVGRRCRWLLPGDILHFLANPERLQMDPPFFEFSPAATVYDGFYPADTWATVGVLVSTAHYLFDTDLWGMLLRGRQSTPRELGSSQLPVAAGDGRRLSAPRSAPHVGGVVTR
jgi:predicted ATP-grasp superfamily ATP-dependent carboligase